MTMTYVFDGVASLGDGGKGRVSDDMSEVIREHPDIYVAAVEEGWKMW